MSKKISILGVKINHDLQEDLLNDAASIFANNKKKSGKARYIVTPNPEIILAAQKDKKFKKILNAAYLSLPDGTGVIWAGAMLRGKTNLFRAIKEMVMIFLGRGNSPFSERITGADFTLKLCHRLKSGVRIFLLGGGIGVAEAAGKKLLQENPELIIAGCSSASATPSHDLKLRRIINQSQANLLLVAFGAPKQEKWLYRNLPHLHTLQLALGVGGTLDFLSGNIKRAPEWIRKPGLEWLYRLIKQPSRIFRIINATFIFPYIFIKKNKEATKHKQP